MIELFPPELSPVAGVTLIATSFFTAALTAAVGLGGGILLLALMALFVPAPAIVPLHGVVQLASNGGRALVQGRHAGAAVVGWFALGSIAGVLLGGRVVFALPAPALQGLLAAFILYAVWGRMPKIGRGAPWMLALGGLVASFLTMFVGATGPFAMAVLLPEASNRLRLVGNHAVCMTIQHGLKVVVFGLLGFGFGPWLGLLAGMVGFGFLGTLVGARILRQTSEQRFRAVFRAVMTLLAVTLAVRAVLAVGSE